MDKSARIIKAVSKLHIFSYRKHLMSKWASIHLLNMQPWEGRPDVITFKRPKLYRIRK